VGFTMRDLLKDWGNQLEYVVPLVPPPS